MIARISVCWAAVEVRAYGFVSFGEGDRKRCRLSCFEITWNLM